jgi:hypothetical protein
MCQHTIVMGDRKIIGSLFCLRANRARNRMAIRMQIRTRVDSPLAGAPASCGLRRRRKRHIKEFFRMSTKNLTRYVPWVTHSIGLRHASQY